MRNEREAMTTDNRRVKNKKRECSEQPYVNNFEILNEMDILLEKYMLLRLTQKIKRSYNY